MPKQLLGSDLAMNCQQRVEITTSCRDCDALPKVPHAGETFGEGAQFQLMHNGVIIRRGAYHGEWMTEVIRRLQGHHEPQEEKVFAAVLEHVPESATMVELGSFWAYYSMWFHQRIKNPTCILVEPHPDKLTLGQEHFGLNGMNGTFINAFVGRESDPNCEFVDWDGSRQRVPMISVDGLITYLKLGRIDILHADVQGAEFDMLCGAERALRDRRIGYLFISTHDFEHRHCVNRLLKFGYRIIAAHSVLEGYSTDGLIVARASECPGPFRVEISFRKASLLQRLRYQFGCLWWRLARGVC